MYSLSKRLILAVLALIPSMALAQQTQSPIVIGFPVYASTSVNQNNLALAATRDAFGFTVSTSGKTLTSFSLYCAAETGTVASGDIHAALHTTTAAGAPHGTATEDVTADFSTACPGWVDFTFNTALTAHTQYFIVLRNANATPASNYIAYRRVVLSNGALPVLGGGSAGSSWGYGFRQSTDSGSTWATGNGSGGWGGVRFGFNGAAYTGIPVFDLAEDANEAYDDRKNCAYFEVPADSPGLRVSGGALIVNWNGTKPLQLAYYLYTGSTPSLVATSQTAEDENLEQSNWIPLHFASVPTLAAGTVGRLCLGPIVASGATDGSAGNAFTLNRMTGRNDSASRALYPFNVKGSYYNGSTWAEDDTKIVPFALLLDTADPFNVAAGSSGPKQNTPGSGGMQ